MGGGLLGEGKISNSTENGSLLETGRLIRAFTVVLW